MPDADLTNVHAVMIQWRVPGADREGMVGVRASFPPSPCVRDAEGLNVRQGGSAQPHLPTVLGLHVAARYAAAIVL